jgi:signal transduction histidine kinase
MALSCVRDGVISVNEKGVVVFMNPEAERLTGWPEEDARGRPFHEVFGIQSGTSLGFMQKPPAGVLNGGDVLELADQTVLNARDGTLRSIAGRAFWSGEEGDTSVNAVVVFREQSGACRGSAALPCIEWLLAPAGRRLPDSNSEDDAWLQPHGDLVDLNTCRLVADAVGPRRLREMVSDCLVLLRTSAVVFESNGDYAAGIISSGWCRFLNSASRALCGNVDNEEALRSGKWLCHESCWTRASRISVETGKAVDIGCAGGIRLHAVPIIARGRVVGALNIGYGDPPKDRDVLARLAERFNVDAGELTQLSAAYESRPRFIVDLAKWRLDETARLLGELVDASQMRDELQLDEERLQALWQMSNMAWDSEEQLMLHALEEAVRLTRSQGGYLHVLSQDEAVVQKSLWSQEALKFCKAPSLEHTGLDGAGIWADSLRLRRPVVHNDYRTAGGRKGLPDGHFEVQRHLGVPILDQDRITLVLGVGNKKAAYDPADVRQLSLFGAALWNLLARKRTELEQKRAIEEKLKLDERALQQQRLESIGTLASGVAHEINNPINAVMNFAQLILDEPGCTEPMRDFGSSIIKESERIAHIVRNLLRFSRRDPEQSAPVLLKDIVTATLSLVAPMLRKDQVVLTCDVADGALAVHCRMQQIQQVLLNLISNASHAVNEQFSEEPGRKKISIRGRVFDRDGAPWVRLTVEDNGPGIRPENRPRIFDPFFTTKQTDRGTGLGLSISYRIVREHQGNLWFETQVGMGTKFHLELPVADPDSQSNSGDTGE